MRALLSRQIGCIPYAEAWELQKSYSEAVQNDKQAPAVLLLCEHPNVYTLGKSGNAHNLLIDDAFLKQIGATYYRTDRGGDITFHGLGQLVGYPILDLESLGMSLREYIHGLEQSVIDTVAEYGIAAGRLTGAIGVWVEPETPRARKICAVGVKASRYVTMHGFALNITTDLSYFNHIHPCGFVDKGVTSIAQECGERPSVEEVAARYIPHFERAMGITPRRESTPPNEQIITKNK